MEVSVSQYKEDEMARFIVLLFTIFASTLTWFFIFMLCVFWVLYKRGIELGIKVVKFLDFNLVLFRCNLKINKNKIIL